MRRSALRLAVVAWFLGVVMAAAAPAFAEERPADAVRTAAEASAPPDIAQLERLIWEHPFAKWLLLGGKYVPAAIGLILLSTMWFRRREQRLLAAAGVGNVASGAPAAIAPPSHAAPTAPFTWPVALLVGIGFVLLQGVLVVVFLGPERASRPGGALDGSLLPLLLGMGLPGLGLAALVFFGRRHPPVGAGPPTPAGRVFGPGVFSFCVAAFVIVPVSVAWMALLGAFDQAPELQDTVSRLIAPTHPSDLPVLIVLAVFLAPLWEEAAFRGLLYPTLRRAFGGGRRAVWAAAILSSLVFAAIHESLTAFMPLFVLALVLAWTMERTNSLWACILAHSLHNATSLLPLVLLHA